MGRVVQDRDVHALEATIRAIPGHAPKVRQRLIGGVVAESDVHIPQLVTAVGRGHIPEAARFETASRDDVEHT